MPHPFGDIDMAIGQNTELISSLIVRQHRGHNIAHRTVQRCAKALSGEQFKAAYTQGSVTSRY